MNFNSIIILLLAFFSYVITESISVIAIFLIFFLIGKYLVMFYSKNDKNAIQIFEVTFIGYFSYALLCSWYMTSNNYNYLQSFDGINVYIPYTKELLKSESFLSLIDKIYGTSKYAFVGAILVIFVYVGKLSLLFDGELYLSIQISILFFASLSSVMVYKILKINNIEKDKLVFYTLIYSLLSIHFYNSTYIVRDMPITFLFLIIIYLSFKKFSIKSLLIMILMISLICTIRISSGIFASSYIFLFLLLSNKNKNTLKKLFVFIFFVSSLIIFILYFNTIQYHLTLKQSQYQEIEANAGDSVVAKFNILPIGISHITKALYNQIMPIPSWQNLIQTEFRPESYNIMNFPIIPATAFRYFMWFTILLGLLSKKTRNIIFENKILLYNFIIALLFISIQSDAMGHRRLLGVYPVFFLTAIIIYQNLSYTNKKNIIFIPTIIFLLLQGLSIIKFI